MASPKSPNSLSRAPAPSSTKSPPASRRRGVVASLRVVVDAPAARSAVRANAATLSRVVSRSARSESTTGSTARMDDGGMDGASSIVNRRAAVRISSRSSKDASTGSGSGDGGVRPPSRPSPSAPSRVPPRSSRGESSCRRRALADDDEDEFAARASASRATTRTAARLVLGAPASMAAKTSLPSGVGTTSMGFWPPAFVASGLAPPGPTSHDTTGQCSCLAATCNGVSPRASLARAETPASSSVCSRTRRTDGRFPRAAAANSAESAAEASSAGGGIAPARTNNASIDAAVPKREFYSRASERSADDPRASPPIARAARRVRRRAIARRLVFARDDDADERTDQAPRDTQRRNPYPSTLRREIRAGTIPLFEVGRPAGEMKCSRRPTVATSS